MMTYIPTPYLIEIKQSIKMGYNKMAIGMINKKTKGVMLINDKDEVRGTYPIILKEAIQNLIEKQ